MNANLDKLRMTFSQIRTDRCILQRGVYPLNSHYLETNRTRKYYSRTRVMNSGNTQRGQRECINCLGPFVYSLVNFLEHGDLSVEILFLAGIDDKLAKTTGLLSKEDVA